MYKILSAKELNIEKWSDFVFTHPQGNVFQTPEYFYSFYNQSNSDALSVVLSSVETDEILGILIAIIYRDGKGIKRFISRRSIIMGGPLVKNNEVDLMYELLKAYDKIAKRKVVYSQFRNMYCMEDFYDIFEKKGYVFSEHLNILLDLTKSEEELWMGLHSTKRNKVRKAKKEGLIIKQIIGINALRDSYEILKEVYSHAKLPFFSFENLMNAYKTLEKKGYIKIFGALFNDKLVGTRIQLCYKDRIFDWYAGSFNDYYNKSPNDLLPWSIFLIAKNEGYKIFDFGGAGKPGIPYGVRDHKIKFGGKLVEYGRYEKVHNYSLFFIGKIGLKTLQWVNEVTKNN